MKKKNDTRMQKFKKAILKKWDDISSNVPTPVWFISSFLIGATLIFGIPAGISAHESRDLKTDYKIVEMADSMDADMSYAKQKIGRYERLKHNDDEPIYVCFNAYMTDEQKQVATEALDYIFGIVGNINPNYRYEIIDLDKYDSLHSQSRLFFTVRELGKKLDGLASTQYSYGSFLQFKPLGQQVVISLDDDTEKDDWFYTYTHELMHAFGLTDVYEDQDDFVGKYQGTTFLKRETGEPMQMITPNDMKVLITLYAPKCSKKEAAQKEKEYSQFIDEYEKLYYAKFVDSCKGQLGNTTDMPQRNFTFHTRANFNQGNKYRYYITIKDNQYTFQIQTPEGEILDSTQGEALWVNGGVVLKEVKLQKGLFPYGEHRYYPNGYVQDFAICQNAGQTAFICDISGDFTRQGMRGFILPQQQEDFIQEQMQ